MTTIEKSVDVRVPVRTAYNQWTQFESFPAFMADVEQVTQVRDTLTHWVTNIDGVHREFDAQIVEQHPDQRVAWRTVDDPEHPGPRHGGEVSFQRVDQDTTRVTLRMEYHPGSLVERAGTLLGVVGAHVEGDLRRFKEFIELRGRETGAWRGDVPKAARTDERGADQPPAEPVQPPPETDPVLGDMPADDLAGMPVVPGPMGGLVGPQVLAHPDEPHNPPRTDAD